MTTSEEDIDTEECDDPALAEQIIKILNHTSESLEEIELSRFLQLFDQLGKAQMDAEEVKSLILGCTDLTLFKEGMTVHLMKQTVRSLIAINEDPKLYKSVWKDISRLAGPLNFSYLAEFGIMDDATLEKYMDLLQHGTENVRHIRLMVVGMFGVGKTTIIGRICNQPVSDIKSTVGIDVSVNACEVDDQKQWKIRNLKAKPEKYFGQRMSNAYHRRTNTGKVTREEMKKAPQPIKKNVLPKPMTPKGNSPISIETEHGQTEMTNPRDTDTEDEPHRPQIAKLKKITSNPEARTKQLLGDIKETFDEEDPVEHERLTTVSIWDFAGQSIYYSTHHFFLSARATYLLVLDISRGLHDVVPEEELDRTDCNRATSMPIGFTCLDAFKFWMNSIYTYTTARRNQTIKEYKPTIVLVGTFKDKVKEMYPEECKQDGWLENYKNDYFEKALLSLEGSEVLSLVHKTKFFVSKDDPKEIFDALKFGLTSIAEGQPFWNEIVPVRLMPLERSIELRKDETEEMKNQDDKCTIMELRELEEIDQETEYPLSDRKLIKFFLNFQHALGNVLYYDAKQLDDSIILDPQWILDVFKLFVTHVSEKESEKIGEWHNFRKNAILTQHLIHELIKQGKRQSFQKYEGKIVHYMEYLDVIAKPVNYEKAPEEDSSSEDEDDDENNTRKAKWPKCKEEEFYIVPCLLSQRPPEEELRVETSSTTKSTPTLCLVFKNNFLPAFVCHRLIATCIRKWEVDLYNRKRVLYREFVRFNLDQTKTSKLELWWKEYILYMRIIRYSGEGKSVSKFLCSRVRQRIQSMIKQIFSIHRNFSGNDTEGDIVQYDEYIQCPRCNKEHLSKTDDDTSDTLLLDMFNVETFKKVDEMNCHQNHTMSKEEALACWFYKENHEYKMEIIRKTRADVFMCLKDKQADSEIKEKDCADLSKGIGKEYIALGIELGLTHERIEQIELEEPNIRTRIKNILLEWRKSCPEPTTAVFKSAFEKITGFRFKNREDSAKEIVKWYEKKENPAASPNERDLIEIIHLVGNRYKRLAKKLFGKNMDARVEQIEMQYSLDFNRTLEILLMWTKESENLTFLFLKDCLVKTFKIKWDNTKRKIAEDEEEEKRAIERKNEIAFLFQSRLQEGKEDLDDRSIVRDMVEGMEDNEISELKEEFSKPLDSSEEDIQ